ncbi:PREDICTED: uncharacterized protein LOC108617360 isoform X1 [Drosophila arizonae]|uniref:Uncharacterized protein LOC108617360 isoform X1 n=1 Tax=Drosophila arizonae TaxID=7263 RepID=A0ABM1PN45_DROAR|nr:PREDICTED: uncharacterized protein LOC108617360 isoform X1 [Drosophila arizonae]
MRLLQIVILTLIVVYPDDVLSGKGSKPKPKSKSKANNKSDLGPCGKRYLRQINGKCYYFAGKKMNWFGAQNNCLRKDLNLADIANKDDFDAVMKFLRSRGNMEDYWFGGNDLQTEGRFTYISTGRPVRYFGGAAAIEPTHRANLDDCLEVRLRYNGTTVTDDNCEEEQYFICQATELKCAQPTEDSVGSQHHSHEHLHHFHHDPTKNENTGNATRTESLESDSRPLDNSNSAQAESKENTTTTENDGTESTLTTAESDITQTETDGTAETSTMPTGTVGEHGKPTEAPTPTPTDIGGDHGKPDASTTRPPDIGGDTGKPNAPTTGPPAMGGDTGKPDATTTGTPDIGGQDENSAPQAAPQS